MGSNERRLTVEYTSVGHTIEKSEDIETSDTLLIIILPYEVAAKMRAKAEKDRRMLAEAIEHALDRMIL